MKRIMIFFLVVVLCACSLKERTDIEINPKPTLIVNYQYINNDGINTFPEEVDLITTFLFDQTDLFIRSESFNRFALPDTFGYTLLSGVPDGYYTVVSFANAEKTEFEELTPGKSHLSDLKAYLHDSTRSSDKLFHSLNRYHVTRGKPVVRSIDLDKLFYQIDLTVTGADKLNVLSEDFTVLFTGIPSGVNFVGESLPEQISYKPYLRKTPENRLIALFSTQRFEKDSPVHMLIRAGNETITDISLSEYLEQNDTGIDFHNDKDVVIPIDIAITSTGVTITVNEWDDGAIQIPVIGN